MSRPLLNADIAKLERLYFTGERDCLQLRQLKHELEFRKSSRADVLAKKVTLALEKLINGEVSLVVAPPPPVNPPPAAKSPDVLPIQPSSSPPAPTRARPARPSASLTTELREAYAALKLTPDAAWEDIEGNRRNIVAQASPAAVAGLPLSEVELRRNAAASANRAAAVLGGFTPKRTQ